MAVRVSVVIPVHNEAATLPAVLADLAAVLDPENRGDIELIVVDDASTDGSGELGRSFVIDLKYIVQPARTGSGAARRAGCRIALGECVVWIDADGTYPAANIPLMIEQLRDFDQVVGARTSEWGAARWLRRAVKSTTAASASWLWDTPIPDLNSGLRVFRRAALLEWLHELPDGFSCTTTATLAALNHGQAVAFFPTVYRARVASSPSKFHPVIDTWKLWQVIARQWYRRLVRRNLVPGVRPSKPR